MEAEHECKGGKTTKWQVKERALTSRQYERRRRVTFHRRTKVWKILQFFKKKKNLQTEERKQTLNRSDRLMGQRTFRQQEFFISYV